MKHNVITYCHFTLHHFKNVLKSYAKTVAAVVAVAASEALHYTYNGSMAMRLRPHNDNDKIQASNIPQHLSVTQ